MSIDIDMAETVTDEVAASWDRRMRDLVPEPVRERAHHELRDRDLFPRDVLRELPGQACRAAHELVRMSLVAITDHERRAFAHWLMPDMPGAAWSAPEVAASFALTRLLHHGFYDPRGVLDRDAALRGRALDAVHGLAKAHDDDRLVSLNFFDEVTRYYLRKGNAYVHYHPFLRRYLSARINTDFTSLLVRVRENTDLDVRVAIDLDRITDTPLMQHIERDYWYGPKLTRTSLDDPQALGVTTHWRSPELERCWAWPLERTEFRWTGDAELKWLQVEELTPPPSATNDGSLAHGAGVGRAWSLILNRYLHCTRDTSAASSHTWTARSARTSSMRTQSGCGRRCSTRARRPTTGRSSVSTARSRTTTGTSSW